VLDHNLVQIGAPAAWRAGDTGAGVKVAVLDSGVDAAFPDLRGQIAARRNFTSPNRSVVTDKVGQGTFVAGLIAGTGRTAGGERRGVAFGARLVIGKVIGNNGFGLESWVIAGMEWAAARARVINMSLEGGLSNGRDPLSQALNRLTASRHVLFVAAAHLLFCRGWQVRRLGEWLTHSASVSAAACPGRRRCWEQPVPSGD
jgi:subtilisin family serine protease